MHCKRRNNYYGSCRYLIMRYAAGLSPWKKYPKTTSAITSRAVAVPGGAVLGSCTTEYGIKPALVGTDTNCIPNPSNAGKSCEAFPDTGIADSNMSGGISRFYKCI